MRDQRAEIAAERVHVRQHEADRIVDFVRDAGGELADRRELLRLQQLLMRMCELAVQVRQLGMARGQLGERVGQPLLAVAQHFVRDADIGGVDDRHAHRGDAAAPIVERHEAAVLPHRVDRAGDRPRMIEAEQIGTVLPRRVHRDAEHEHALQLLAQPARGQLRKEREQILADRVVARAARVVLHEAVPREDAHVVVDREHAAVELLDDCCGHLRNGGFGHGAVRAGSNGTRPVPRGARARQTASNTPDYGLAARRPHTENPCPRRWGWGWGWGWGWR
ncbi:Uncharacterised protein [Burkholderia pseudomallei]|nr:Uncharacterised protein [Burkholderia pseudomallei]VBY29342.1 Uncharacterised protein [Burkholderia pseudomallei]